MIDPAKMQALMGQIMQDLGGAASVATVRMGDALGLYKALHAKGPMNSVELAAAAGTNERYTREWLAQQAASNYLAYDSATRKFALSPEQASVFGDENSPTYMMGGFDVMAAMIENQAKVQHAFKHGGGVAWGDQAGCLFCATARFFWPGYRDNLVRNWLPALDGMIERLKRGAKVADVGCGYGWSTVLMAEAFPNSHFTGYDFHPGSVERARDHAASHKVSANTSFEVAAAKSFAGRDFDLVACFDCLHDMGDPAGAAAHIHAALKPDGIWMIVEPHAGDRLEDNLTPMGRLAYAGSTMVCIPTSLAQEVGLALGAQAGEARLREVITAGGFKQVRRAVDNDFNMILEARP